VKKTKIIAILTAFIIVTAMTSIVAAETTVTLNPDPISVHQGDSTVVTVTVENTATVGLTYNLGCTPFYKEDGITVESTISGTVEDEYLYVAAGSSATTQLTISTQPGTPDGQYIFTVSAFDGMIDYVIQGDAVVGTLNLIPEFATIAIPAVALLGLFLFFNRRKGREE